jgi:ubiquinone/menaquinone biosynthesis C-methylase UbiE
VFLPGGPTFIELARQALSSTECGYDLLAPKFERTPFRTPEPMVAAVAKAVGPPGTVDDGLDVCCGTGAVLAHLLPRCRRRAVGLDFSAGMLNEARERLEGEGAKPARDLPRLELIRGDALSLPFRAEFDVITCAGAFGHVLRRDEDRFISGIARALRPGGRFIFPTTEKPSLVSSAWWLARAFNAAMHVRNAMLKPEFIMYYLTFLWPDVRAKLARHGLQAEGRTGLCETSFERVVIVIAKKHSG